MNKQYKLVQCYPSLPSDWEEGMLVGQGDRPGSQTNFSPCAGYYSNFQLKYEEVVNNPKFWEKVEEVKLNVPIGTKFTFIDYSNIIYQIIKVENDKVVFHNEQFVKGHDFLCPIKSVNEHFKNGNWIICKEPIFKDFLGNSVFEGDKVFGVLPKANWQYNYYGGDGIPANLLTNKNTEWIYFLKKSDAHQYILDNKPVYSRKEVLEALDRELNYLGVVSAKENIKKILGL